jgi:lipoate synthase
MILGNTCTALVVLASGRGRPETVDWDEPEKVALHQDNEYKHAVITMLIEMI